jgi:hypothetical protein
LFRLTTFYQRARRKLCLTDFAEISADWPDRAAEVTAARSSGPELPPGGTADARHRTAAARRTSRSAPHRYPYRRDLFQYRTAAPRAFSRIAPVTQRHIVDRCHLKADLRFSATWTGLLEAHLSLVEVLVEAAFSGDTGTSCWS